jgi:translation initiation factor 2B subunit (eIF-2B alpha/beta/delta family)
VEFLVVAAPRGSRVVVVESQPRFPLVALATAFTRVFA